MSDGLIHFRCPNCRVQMATLAANAEHQVECPGCNAVLVVPFLPLHTQLDAVVTAEEAAMEFRPLSNKSDSEMDMTPMVDVTFLLLIFFMVTAAFAMQKSFQVPFDFDKKHRAANE